MRQSWLVVCLVAGCSGGGSHFFFAGGGDDGGGGDLAMGTHDLGGTPHPDLSSLLPDLAMLPDLTTPPPPPDLATPCHAGHYQGALAGTVNAGGGLNVPVKGTVDLTLDPPQNGTLNISNGKMNATYMFNGTAMADVVGSLDCGSLKLTGTLQNGKATALGQTIPFSGSVAADYDIQQSALVNGTWMTTGLMGSGTWSAQ